MYLKVFFFLFHLATEKNLFPALIFNYVCSVSTVFFYLNLSAVTCSWYALVCCLSMLHVVNRIREMVRFELSKEIEKTCFSFCQERGTKKKSWVPVRNQTSNIRSEYPSVLFYFANTTLLIGIADLSSTVEVCRTRVTYEIRNGPRSQ